MNLIHTFFFLLLIGILNAQSFDQEKLDLYLKTLEKEKQIMGSVSLLENGKEIYQRNLGFVDIENNIRAKAQTQYRVGSITKTFTAALIFQLIDEGKLTLTTPLSQFYPNIQNSDQILIQNLLNHSSGLFNVTKDSTILITKQYSKQALLNKIESYKPAFSPNQKSEYSNTNYIFLGWILEAIEQDDYANILQTRIAKPLGLEKTKVGGPINTKNAQEALSYGFDSENWALLDNHTNMSLPQAAGNIISTPSDLNRFLHALFDYKIISKESLAQMQFMRESYGSGLFRVPFYKKSGFGHNGKIDAFNAVAYYFPKEKFGISVLSNGQNMLLNDVVIGILSIYFDLDFEIPKFNEHAIEFADWKDYTGFYQAEDFPLDIEIFKENNVLYGQATGQGKFPLTPKSKHKFAYKAAGIQLIFSPKNKQMTLKQSGQIIPFTKKEN